MNVSYRSLFLLFLIIVTTVVLLACTGSPGNSSADSGTESQDIRIQLVDKARWAMSAHNMQPWKVYLDQEDPLSFSVHLANDRLLPATDPYSRQIIMSIGGFLAVIEDSAASLGYSSQFAFFPDGLLPVNEIGDTFSAPVARVSLTELGENAVSEYMDALTSATVKADLSTITLSEAEVLSYSRINTYEGIDMWFMQDEQDDNRLSTIKPILKSAFRLEMEHEPTLMESYDLMRRSRKKVEKQPWGLSYASNFPAKKLGTIEFFETLFPARPVKWGIIGADKFDEEVDRAGAVLIITTEGNTRVLQVQAGMLFQKIWMKAIIDGYAIVPASQPLQEYAAMSGYYEQIHNLLAEPGQTIQMIAFLGRPEEGYLGGFRLPLDKITAPE